MSKEFIPYEEALALKELGFDEECFGYFQEKEFNLINKQFNANKDNGDFLSLLTCSAPLYQQAFRWFREEHNLSQHIYVDDSHFELGVGFFYEIFEIKDNCLYEEWSQNDKSKTYEEAELACLRKLIEIVKDEQRN